MYKRQITDGTNIYTLGGMITGYTITNPGNNYSLSSTIPISGGGGLGANFIIDKLSSGVLLLQQSFLVEVVTL